jgi:hypothetical protein
LIRKIFILTIIFFINCFYAQDYDFIGKPYYRYQVPDSISADSVLLKKENKESSRLKPYLLKKGTIYRGIKINADSGAGMVSGLNLEVKGNLTDSLEVAAYISDDQLAVSEEGSTEAISDIEKIYIQFKHPNFLSRMGDFKASYENGEFGELKKDLSGAFLKINNSSSSIDGFVSAQSTNFETFRTNGSEGISGPYIIKTSSSAAVEIIPNTETVYLNGSRMIRGDDYFIDNQISELYFRPRIHIKGGDIIIVDYQYISSDYKRLVYGFNTENSFIGNKLKTSINYYSEADDKTKPLSFEMNDEISDNMANNSDGYILISGAEFTEGSGSYDLMSDSLHYVYTGADSGDYKVSFSYFYTGGEYDISYDSLGTAYYVYDPLGGGDYLPLVRRNAPKGYSRFHTAAGYAGRNVIIEAEMAASGSNDNLIYSEDKKFSGFGDREMLLLRTDEKSYGKFELDLSRKSYNDDLVLPSRLNKVSSEEEIDPYGQAKSNRSAIYKAMITHRFGNYTVNSYESGYSETGISLTGRTDRIRSDGNFGMYSYSGIVTLSSLTGDSIKTEKSYYDLSSSFTTEKLKFRPYYKNVILKNITDPFTSGTDEKKFGNEFDFFYTDAFDLNINSEIAVYDNIYGSDRKEYLKRFANSAGLKSRISSVLYSEALWSKVINEYISGDSTNTDFDQLNFRINYNKNDEYRVYAEYETERTQFIPKIRSYYKVEEGTGGFVFVDGEYFPDEFGNYDYYTVFSGIKKNLTGVKLDLKTFFDFKDQSKNENILYWLSQIDIEQDLTIKEKTADPEIRNIMFLNIADFQNDSTISGTIESKTNLYFLKKGNNSFDYSYNYRKNLYREFQNYTDNSLFREQTVSYRNRSGGLTHKVRGKISSTERKGFSNIITDDLQKKYVSYIIRNILNNGTSISAELEYGKETESVRDISSDSYRMSSSLSAVFYGRGIFRSGLDVIRILSVDNIPFTMNSGYGKGWSYKWNISSDYDFNKNIVGNLTYFGRYLSSDHKPFHEFKAEIRMNL